MFPSPLCRIYWDSLCLTPVCMPQLFHRGQSSEMALSSFLILTSLCIAGREALTLSDCGAYARRPGKMALSFFCQNYFVMTCMLFSWKTQPESLIDNDIWPPSEYTDIAVVCGTSAIDLAIQICPVIYTGYNTSLLILNRIRDNVDCQGTLDTSVVPPVVRFSFPIREGNACGSNFMVSIVSWFEVLRDVELLTERGCECLVSDQVGCESFSLFRNGWYGSAFWLTATHSILPVYLKGLKRLFYLLLLWFQHCCTNTYFYLFLK